MTVIEPEDINRLKNLLARGTKEPPRAPLLWAGAGLSIPSGYPSLGQLAEKLRTKSPVSLPKDLAPMETIDAFVKENGKGDLAEALADIFDRKKPLQYHRDLMKLTWKAVITTNYDELLEDALKELDRKFIKVTLGENLDLTARPELALFKIHGDLSGFRSMVLSGQSYADYRQRYALLKQDLESLLRKHHVVYFGCSMTDPRLIDWLESLGRENREQLMSSCTVITEAGWNSIPQETRKLLDEATVKPVFVKDHAQIPELISFLVKTIAGGPDREELKLIVDPTPDYKNQWQVIGFDGSKRIVDSPWKKNHQFLDSLNLFLKMANAPISKSEERLVLHDHAVSLGDELAAAVLSDSERETIKKTYGLDGPPPFVVIESQDDIILSLPWELIRMDGDFLIRSGRIDIARMTPPLSIDPPHLTKPDRPMSLVINVSAPEDGNVGYLDHEAESYRINKALCEHIPVHFTELGTLGDLVKTIARQLPVGVHFSGHGSPGKLLFEDDTGMEHPVTIHDLISRIRIEAPEKFPRFVYLASCHGNTTVKPDEQKACSTITAAQLHREGVVQVIGYFGPIVDELSTIAEVEIYRTISKGKTTRDAVRKARGALAAVADGACESPHRNGVDRDIRDVFPYAWAQLVFYHRGPDYPLSLKSPTSYITDQEIVLHREFFEETTQRQQLTTGFIGRRRQLHTFRRMLKKGRRVFVFQGLGGLGKSTLAFKALTIIAKESPTLTFWCQEIEDKDDQAGALVSWLSDFGQKLWGNQWFNVVKTIDRKAEKTQVERFGMFLDAIVKKFDHIVLHFENMESLIAGPENDDPKAFGSWKNSQVEAIWHLVKKISGDKVSVVASCRYRNKAFDESIVHVPEMGPNDIFRLMGWFQGLRRLSMPNRVRLVSLVHGHPRAVEYLDDLVRDQICTWEDRYGQLPQVSNKDEAEKQWRDIVSPALPNVEQRLVQNLLLSAIWDRILDERCRHMLFRMTVLRRPWDWDLMMELGEPGEDTTEAEKTAGRLRDTSLLSELEEKRNNCWEKLYHIHPSTISFIRSKFDKTHTDTLRLATCLRVGYWLKKKAESSADIRDTLDAGYYLFECGKFDSASDLLMSASQTLQYWGKVREGINVISALEKQDVLEQLDPHRAGQLLGIMGLAHHRLAAFIKAIDYFQRALAIARKINDRHGEETRLGNLGNAYQALGQLEKAIEYHKKALVIAREIEDRYGEGSDLGNLGIAYHALGQVEKAIDYYEQALAITTKIGDRRGEGNHLGNLGIAYSDLGQVNKAVDYHKKALIIASEIGDLRGKCKRLGNIALAFINLKEVEKAIDYYEQALAIARQIGDRRSENYHLGNIGLAFSTLGKVVKAIDCHEQALIIAREIRDRRSESNHLGNLGQAYSALDQIERAIGYHEQALIIAREIGDLRYEAKRVGNLGQAYGALGQVEKARTLLQEAVDLGKKINDYKIVRKASEKLEELNV